MKVSILKRPETLIATSILAGVLFFGAGNTASAETRPLNGFSVALVHEEQ